MIRRWKHAAFLRRVTGLLDGPPSPELLSAIAETAEVLTPRMLGGRLRAYREELVLIFARQSADAAMRLSSSHWSSSGGRNVGHDVLLARSRALEALKQVAGRRPAPRDALGAFLQSLDDLMTAHRQAPGDDDGYGIATLGEIHRDVARLIAASR